MISASRTGVTHLLALLVTVLFACSPEQPEAGAEIPLETEDDKTIYAMGVNLSGNVGHVPMNDSEKEILQAGFADGIHGRDPKVDVGRYGRRVEDLFRRRNANLVREDPEEAEAFLAEAAAVEGARRSDSGMVMVLLRPGDGPSPGPTDRVKVHYHGTLRDGTVFDSSFIRGEPMVLTLNRTIACWTEALPKMKTGEKSLVTCPAEIAYGDEGAPPLIKPGAALAFEIELLGVLE